MTLHEDDGGIPGALVLPPMTPVFPARSPYAIERESIFQYGVDVGTIALAPGTCWLSVVSLGAQGGDVGNVPPPRVSTVVWQQGELDGVGGIDGAAALSAAQPIWRAGRGEFALALCGPPALPDVPTLQWKGGALLALLLVLAASRRLTLRRDRTES